MADFNLSNKALEDLSKIWDYTFEVWSENQADKYYSMLLSACQELAEDKLSSRNYPEIREDIFGCRIGQHIVFYRKAKSSKIEVVRILHNRMDLKNRML